MKKLLIPFAAILLLIWSCGNNNSSGIKIAHYEYISAYTYGTISRTSNIYVEFNDNLADYGMLNEQQSQSLLSFDQSVSGKTVWLNNRTIQFLPDEMLPSNTEFNVRVDLKQLVDTVPDSLRYFDFRFRTKQQWLNVEIGNLENVDNKELKWMKLTGRINTGDAVNPDNLAKVLSVIIDGSEKRVKWSHTGTEQHDFVVDSIERKNDERELKIRWDGEPVAANDSKGEKSLKVLALGDFKYVGRSLSNELRQEVTLEFSDPIKKDQDLEGLIRIGNYDIDYLVEGNLIRVYPLIRLIGDITVNVEAGIMNILGHKLQRSVSVSVKFKELKPEVRLSEKGVIIPQGKNVPLVFEAVNLSAIDVRVIKIYEKSVPQFLQVNELAGSHELKRVGHVLMKKKIELTKNNDIDLKNWNKHILDLSDLIQTEPGAIYEIALGFRRSYSLYTCMDSTSGPDSGDMLAVDDDWDVADVVEEGDSYWDYWYEDESDHYSYENRNNPCKKEYYSSDKVAKRNVLASGLGIIVKRSPDNQIMVAVTDIKTTDPIQGVSLEIYNYQQHLLSRSITNGDGIAKVDVDGTPFLLVARHGKERGYLKLNDANSIMVSRFDVGGKKYQQGINGFIYEERGVRRPGDSVYVAFMLEDKRNTLPADHPVVFELFNPKGQLVKRIAKTIGLNDVYTFRAKTDENAITGNYLCKVHAGGSTFTKSIKVETIVPNRLKIRWKNEPESLSNKDNHLQGDIEVTWLHGAVAADLKLDVSMTLTSAKTTFKRFNDYVFDDPSRQYYPEEKTIYQGQLDDNGKATIEYDIVANNEAPGMLRANFKTRAFEPGGNFSVDRYGIDFHPYEHYVGINVPKGDASRGMLLTDTNHIIRVATVDKNGEPVSGRKVEFKLYKLEWKWWWEKDKDEVNYNGRYYNNPIVQGEGISKDGIAKWAMQVNYPQWGRYLIKATDQDGHSTGKVVYIDWPGWAGRAQKDNVGGASVLAFTSDKPEYKVGDDITLNIPTGAKGRALVSIENGDRILKTQWVNAVKGMTRVTFTATSEMTPNIYASVTLLQPYEQTANDLPMRLFGTIPVKVKDPSSLLEPELKMANVIRPKEVFEVGVSESNGKPMTYTLAVVDEGLLDLTRFGTPDPWNHFFQKKALDIKTWDLYEDIVGAESGKIRSVLSIGGDGSLSGKDGGDKVNRFTPVVKFLGPFKLAEGERKTHHIQMPNYIGSVRTMVVARSEDAYGSVERATPVKKPLMVLASLPRVLRPEEEIELPVTVFAMDKKIQDVQVSLTSNDKLEIIGAGTKTVQFKKEGDHLVTFRVKVKSVLGLGNLRIEAKSAGERAVYDVDVDVLAPNPPVTEVYNAKVLPGKSWEKTVEAFGFNGSNSTILEVSAMPPLNLASRLDYLIRYPHGCIEQTTSSVFPQLFLTDLVEISPEMVAKTERNIRIGINRLHKFQTPQGGLGYWPGATVPSEWGTNYAGHFLIEAGKKGFTIPEDLMSQWLDFQRNKARAWSTGDQSGELIQAYRLYLLSLAEKPELGAMNRMRLSKNITPAAKWYLAAAYKLAVKPEVADDISRKLTTEVEETKNTRYTYGSRIRDRAIVLHALSITGGREEEASVIAEEISTKLNSSEFMSTQSTAFGLFALMKYKDSGKTTQRNNFSYKAGKDNWKKVSADKMIWRNEITSGEKTMEVFVKNASEIPLYVQVMNKGIPTYENTLNEVLSGIINMEVQYYNNDGSVIDPSNIEQGKDIVVEVKITPETSAQRTYNIALTHIFPSGWEIQNPRFDPHFASSSSSVSDYQDIRDDRILTYYNLSQKIIVFRYKVNASYAGKFYLPAVQTEGMYDHDIQGYKKGMWIEVVKEQPAGS